MTNARTTFLIAVVHVLMAPQCVFSQTTLNGSVFGNQNLALEYATVALYNQTDTSLIGGTITDKNGTFTIAKVQKGKYFLKIKCMGYADFQYPAFNVSGKKETIFIDSIILHETAILVDEVEVSAKRNVVEQQLDKKVLYVANNIEAGTSNALEIVKRSPSVSINIDGGLSIRGNSDIVILVDGRPQTAGGNSMLESIPATSIEKIEIITNPSAKYQSEGTGGIINIILKKSKKDNFNALVNAKWGSASKELIDFNTQYNKDWFHFHGKLMYSDMGRSNQSWRTRTLYLDTVYHFRDDFTERRYSNNDYIASIGSGIRLERVELFLNFKTGLFELWRFKKGVQSQWNDVTSDELNTLSTIESLIHWRYNQYDVLFNYQSPNKKHTWQNSWYYSVDWGNDNFWYEGYPVTSELFRLGSTEKSVSGQEGTMYYQQLKSDYSYKIDSLLKIEAGAFVTTTNRDHRYYTGAYNALASEYEYSPGEIVSDIYQDILAAYVNIKGARGNLKYQAGLRYEYDNQEIRPNTDTVYAYVGKDLLPSVHASYNINRQTTVFASYSKRKKLPSHWQIVPAYFGYDKYISGYGNPALKPCYANKAELGANSTMEKLRINSTLYVSDSQNEVALMHKQGEGLRTDRYFLNVDKHRSVGLDIDAQYPFTQWLELRMNANVFNDNYRMNSEGFAIDRTRNTLFSKAFLTIKPLKNTTVLITSVYATREDLAGMYYKPWYYTDVSIAQSFLHDKLKLSVKSGDVFQTSQHSGTVWLYEGFDGAYANWEKRYILFGLTFNFNKYAYTDKTTELKRGAM